MDFKCKYCGSVNLELEEKGNQTGLYCCDCGKWLKWLTKEEKRVFNNKNACTPIYVPKGATNGDMIMAMFNCMVIGISNGKVYVEHIYFPFDEEWWSAPYKPESEEE